MVNYKLSYIMYHKNALKGYLQIRNCLEALVYQYTIKLINKYMNVLIGFKTHSSTEKVILTSWATTLLCKIYTFHTRIIKTFCWEAYSNFLQYASLIIYHFQKWQFFFHKQSCVVFMSTSWENKHVHKDVYLFITRRHDVDNYYPYE